MAEVADLVEKKILNLFIIRFLVDTRRGENNNGWMKTLWSVTESACFTGRWTSLNRYYYAVYCILYYCLRILISLRRTTSAVKHFSYIQHSKPKSRKYLFKFELNSSAYFCCYSYTLGIFNYNTIMPVVMFVVGCLMAKFPGIWISIQINCTYYLFIHNMIYYILISCY